MNIATPIIRPSRAAFVALHRLELAPENPRSDATVDAAKVADLQENILELGVLTPLLGYAYGNAVFITAGGRRLRALRNLRDAEKIDAAYEVPVSIMDQADAIEAGVAEQLTHERMTPVDELRVFDMPGYADMTDAMLGRMVGRSASYVAQRRLILSLPDPIKETLFAGEISVDQAMGLTYLRDDDAKLGEMFEAACGNPRLTGSDIRESYTRDVRAWSDYPASQIVTAEAYRAAGGRFQEDLFADTRLVLTYRSAVDDPARFTCSKKVGPWAGLTPSRNQSGERDVSGGITKAGDVTLRRALYRAATVMMHRGRSTWLRTWAAQVARRRGGKRAMVALARRIGVILHRMWVDDADFRLDIKTPYAA